MQFQQLTISSEYAIKLFSFLEEIFKVVLNQPDFHQDEP